MTQRAHRNQDKTKHSTVVAKISSSFLILMRVLPWVWCYTQRQSAVSELTVWCPFWATGLRSCWWISQGSFPSGLISPRSMLFDCTHETQTTYCSLTQPWTLLEKKKNRTWSQRYLPSLALSADSPPFSPAVSWQCGPVCPTGLHFVSLKCSILGNAHAIVNAVAGSEF